jgi:DNA (cytosine-5)-methyltransferase 1
LDLFSGIGGIGLALSPWVRTIAYCEQDRYAQGTLLSRMRSGEIDTAPIWDDVRTLRAEHLPRIDIISGGFPCQDLSVAGRGEGLEGQRSGLFFEIVRLTEELKPLFVFLENVPAIRTRGLDVVLKEFTALGYDCRWTVVSAESIGAPHKRERWFLLAHSNGERVRNKQELKQKRQSKTELEHDGKEESMAHSNSTRCARQGSTQSEKRISNSKPSRDSAIDSNTISKRRNERRGNELQSEQSKTIGQDFSDFCTERNEGEKWWSVEPTVGRVAHGIPHRVERVKCLGNSVVPLQVRKAFKILSGVIE